jgi:hypothetical protein
MKRPIDDTNFSAIGLISHLRLWLKCAIKVNQALRDGCHMICVTVNNDVTERF